MRAALQGNAGISDIHLSLAQGGEQPSITFLMPVRDADQRLVGVALLLVRAKAFWDIVRTCNGLAGPGSFAVLFDPLGIRIAHTYSDDIVFHPKGTLDAPTIDRLVTERCFGTSTRALLEDVRAFPDQFDRSRASTTGLSVFRDFAAVNQTWNYGVARRFQTVPWTVFYMSPAANIDSQIQQTTRQEVTLAAGIIVVAQGIGLIVVAGGGDLSARMQDRRSDEPGQLGDSFNAGRAHRRAVDRTAASARCAGAARSGADRGTHAHHAALAGRGH